MAATEIKFCGCDSKFQDRRYGQQKRLHNVGVKGASCTVCGTLKSGYEKKK